MRFRRSVLILVIGATSLVAAGAQPNEPSAKDAPPKDATRPSLIAGHCTVEGAVASHRPSPIPVHQTYGPRDWQKQPFRLAVIMIDFSDTKHDPAHPAAFYENMVLGQHAQLKTATGKPGFGSVADWYASQSQGRFVLSGKVFDWITVEPTYKAVHDLPRKEAEDKYLRAAETAVKQRDGEHALDGFDGLFFIHAGPIAAPTNNILWSHRWILDGSRYLTTFETETINVACHEFGHMLGLPDLYGKPGVRQSFGPWCAMAAGYRGESPGSFCAWSKSRLGWCQPTVIDPDTSQKLVLRPIQTNPNNAFLIPLNAHDGAGSEFLLLENRADVLNDTGRQHGLLIWRISRGSDPQKQATFTLTLPGPDDDSGASLKDRQVTWPFGTAHDYLVKRTDDLTGVALRNIRLIDGNVFFEIAKPD